MYIVKNKEIVKLKNNRVKILSSENNEILELVKENGKFSIYKKITFDGIIITDKEEDDEKKKFLKLSKKERLSILNKIQELRNLEEKLLPKL